MGNDRFNRRSQTPAPIAQELPGNPSTRGRVNSGSQSREQPRLETWVPSRASELLSTDEIRDRQNLHNGDQRPRPLIRVSNRTSELLSTDEDKHALGVCGDNSLGE